jgi:polyisoprenoid-binding protein YceI
MTQQNIVRLIAVVLVVAIAAFVLVTWTGMGAPAPEIAAAVASPTVQAPTPATDAPVEEAVPSSSASLTETSTETSSTTPPEIEGDDVTPFIIDQAASEARFVINEVLLGNPTEVTGVTSLVSGTLAIDVADPANTTVSTITIDARDLSTDRNLRNRAIRRFILESNKDEYQYITFTPTAVEGLPPQAAAGDSFSFQITGDLKIKDISQPVTFNVDVQADSEEQISGLATATVTRSDFNLSIPSAPGVADVTDEVRLELAFTARAE